MYHFCNVLHHLDLLGMPVRLCLVIDRRVLTLVTQLLDCARIGLEVGECYLSRAQTIDRFSSSVERVVEYLDLPQEPPAIIESNRPPAYWPSSADNSSLLVVEDLVIKYSPELPAVLHGISFSLKSRERVGLLGRTGKPTDSL